MKGITGAALAAAFLPLALLMSGCTMLHMSYPVAQSHFQYPNSNVTAMGHATGSATTVGMMPSMQDADLEEQAINQALQKSGGDLLIDYHLTTDVKLIPLMFISLYQTTVSVDGTAAKMEIGKQALH